MLAVLKPGAPELERAVLARLAACEELENVDIEVRATGAVVVLSGAVDCYARKVVAERAARGVPGVRAVVDRIEVPPGAGGDWRDVDIQKAAETALRVHYLLGHRPIDVVVDRGFIRLTGRVATEAERAEAERVVTPLPGLRGIRDDLVVFDGPARKFV
jgi:osmotically-inducible protein OsmY